jgi:hypothetical protein
MAESHFFLYFCYRGPLGLMGFGPLANFWTFGFGLLWTEKMGLYNLQDVCSSFLQMVQKKFVSFYKLLVKFSP